MVKKFTVFKVLIALIILGIIAIPVTALISIPQFKFYQNPLDSLTPGTIDNNGIITKSFTIYVSNYGFYDLNSLMLVTTVLNESLYPYSEPNYFMIWGIPKGSTIPINIVMRINTNTLNTTGTIGDFLNTSSILAQTILDAKYAFSLTSLSTVQITQLGALSPMYNLSTGPAVLDLATNATANITIGFLNFLQGYTVNINATLYNSSGTNYVASGASSYSVSSAEYILPYLSLENVTISTGGAAIVAGTGYSLVLRVTSPFGYVYTNSTYEVVPT